MLSWNGTSGADVDAEWHARLDCRGAWNGTKRMRCDAMQQPCHSMT